MRESQFHQLHGLRQIAIPLAIFLLWLKQIIFFIIFTFFLHFLNFLVKHQVDMSHVIWKELFKLGHNTWIIVADITERVLNTFGITIFH